MTRTTNSSISFLIYASGLGILLTSILSWRRRDKSKEDRIELHYATTRRNFQILSTATELKSQPWGYSNAHLASILAQIRPSPFYIFCRGRASRQMENIQTPTGYIVQVEYINPINEIPPNTPIVILLHGVGGSSREAYIEQTALHIVDKGWRVAVLNYSNVSVLEGESYSLGGNSLIESGNINFLISLIRQTHNGFLAAIGFSMGGTKLVQYLVRAKQYTNLDAACVISAPLDYTIRNDSVHKPSATFVTKMYHFVVANHLKLWIIKNYFQLRKHRKIKSSIPFQINLSGLLWWLRTNCVTEIDREITMPLKGREQSELLAYYDDATALSRLRDVRTPLLCITANNDPFIPIQLVPSKDIALENENIFIANTSGVGGHIGYWMFGCGCWASKAAISFFDSVQLTEVSQTPRYLRKKSSIDAAYNLQRTSKTGLTDYFDLIASGSISEFDTTSS